MATEVRRKQVCKTDYNVNPGYENPGKEEITLSEWIGGADGTQDDEPGKWAKLRRCFRDGGGDCLLRGKHWRGRNILRIRHSTHKHDRMENWGTQLLVLETKSTSLHRLISHKKLKHVFTWSPQQSTKKKGRDWSDFQSFPSGSLPTWASRLPHSKVEGGGGGDGTLCISLQKEAKLK